MLTPSSTHSDFALPEGTSTSPALLRHQPRPGPRAAPRHHLLLHSPGAALGTDRQHGPTAPSPHRTEADPSPSRSDPAAPGTQCHGRGAATLPPLNPGTTISSTSAPSAHRPHTLPQGAALSPSRPTPARIPAAGDDTHRPPALSPRSARCRRALTAQPVHGPHRGQRRPPREERTGEWQRGAGGPATPLPRRGAAPAQPRPEPRPPGWCPRPAGWRRLRAVGAPCGARCFSPGVPRALSTRSLLASLGPALLPPLRPNKNWGLDASTCMARGTIEPAAPSGPLCAGCSPALLPPCTAPQRWCPHSSLPLGLSPRSPSNHRVTPGCGHRTHTGHTRGTHRALPSLGHSQSSTHCSLGRGSHSAHAEQWQPVGCCWLPAVPEVCARTLPSHPIVAVLKVVRNSYLMFIKCFEN